MFLAILGICIGLVIGYFMPIAIPLVLSRYTAVAVIAIFDSLIGAIRADIEGEYDARIFLSGLVFNMAIAGGITYLGDQLGLELYLGVIIVFTLRMFSNGARLRYKLLGKILKKEGSAKNAQLLAINDNHVGDGTHRS
jgi:small basic protein